MRALAAAAIAVWSLAAGVLIGYALNLWIGDDDSRTVTIKQLVLRPPEAVNRTQLALLAAAEARDYEAVRRLIPSNGFSYTFGGPVRGGPIAFWQQLERTGERPLQTLSALLQMPWTMSVDGGTYIWPRAYNLSDAVYLSDDEREQLSRLGDVDKMFIPGTGYIGWRVGIARFGAWTFFVAGD